MVGKISAVWTKEEGPWALTFSVQASVVSSLVVPPTPVLVLRVARLNENFHMFVNGAAAEVCDDSAVS